MNLCILIIFHCVTEHMSRQFTVTCVEGFVHPSFLSKQYMVFLINIKILYIRNFFGCIMLCCIVYFFLLSNNSSVSLILVISLVQTQKKRLKLSARNGYNGGFLYQGLEVGRHRKVTASPLQGVVTGQKSETKIREGGGRKNIY